jgi:hypothetical protein
MSSSFGLPEEAAAAAQTETESAEREDYLVAIASIFVFFVLMAFTIF